MKMTRSRIKTCCRLLIFGRISANYFSFGIAVLKNKIYIKVTPGIYTEDKTRNQKKIYSGRISNRPGVFGGS